MTPRESPPDRCADALAWAAAELQYEQEERVTRDVDQTASDLERSQAHGDQMAAEADQLASDLDQRHAHRDQHASDRDQAAADWESAHAPPDPAGARAREQSRFERRLASEERAATAAARKETAARRLALATKRDEAARARDQASAARDRAARTRDEDARARDVGAEAAEAQALDAEGLDDAVAALRALRTSAAAVRREGGEDRARAAADREQAAADRRQAAADREYYSRDDVTGVLRRGQGELVLSHEVDLARRRHRPLAVAAIDVPGLDAVKDTDGDEAGDALLRDVAQAAVATLRSYDVVVRWDRDEFICAMSDATLDVAADRMADVRRVLNARRPGASVCAGLAELDVDDTLESLIMRADADLQRSRAERCA
jgi:diguanylate cyclase (GGDEF)-like protein